MNRHDAYTALLMRHRTMLWRMCRRRAHGDRDLACDLLQEVSIALWENFHKLRPESTLHQERAWVCWQARSVFDQRDRRPQLNTEPLSEVLADTLADEDSLQHKETLDDLLAALSPDEQQMMRLYLEGYSPDEISKQMGLKRDTVYQRMHRATRKMKGAVLLLAALLLTAAVAVAVVPIWRHLLGGSDDTPQETVIDTLTPPSDTMASGAVDPAPDSVVHHIHKEPRPAVAAMEHLSSEILPVIPTEPPAIPEHNDIILSVNGNRLTVIGAIDELVRIYDMSGILVASRQCNGFCIFDLFPNTEALSFERNNYRIEIGSRPALLLKL